VSTRTLGLAAAGLAVVGVIVVALSAGGLGGASLPVPKLPDDGVRCASVAARGTDLVCTATTTSLNGLLPRERRERLAKTRPVAKAAGFAQIVFEDEGRAWRIESVDAAP
jgi:hypothetical protein